MESLGKGVFASQKQNKQVRLQSNLSFWLRLIEFICMQMEGKKKQQQKIFARLHQPVYLELYVCTTRAALHQIALFYRISWPCKLQPPYHSGLQSKSLVCKVYANKKTKTIHLIIFLNKLGQIQTNKDTTYVRRTQTEAGFTEE